MLRGLSTVYVDRAAVYRPAYFSLRAMAVRSISCSLSKMLSFSRTSAAFCVLAAMRLTHLLRSFFITSYRSEYSRSLPHTHTPVQRPFFRDYTGERVPENVKPMWILLKQETVSGSGISWDICKSAPHSRQITTPAPYHLVFLQAGCPSCRPTNSVS